MSMHLIYFPTGNGETKTLRKSSSSKLLDTFTKGNLSLDIHASRLQSGNAVYDDIFDSLEEIIELVNTEGVWTVYGWGRRGLKNDVSILGNYIKVPGNNKDLSKNISTRVIHLHPEKKDYLDLWTICGRSLDDLKFDFHKFKYSIAIHQIMEI